MANELIHTVVGTELTQTEYEAGTGHSFNSQATGDILYASSATQLSRLGIGSTNDILTVTAGIPAWTATPTLSTVTLSGGAMIFSGAGGATVTAGNYEIRRITTSNRLAINVPSGSEIEMSENGQRFINADGSAVVFNSALDAYTFTIHYNGGTNLVVISGTNRSVKVGANTARATTAGTNILSIFDGTAPVGTLTNGVTLYSSAGKLFAMDADGVATQLTP